MRYKIQYVRVENQMYTFDIEANSEKEATELAADAFFDNEYKVVHSEEFIHDISLIEDSAPGGFSADGSLHW